MRSLLSTLCEVAGFGLLTAAAWTIHPALGLAAGGAAAVIVGAAIDPPGRGR